MPELYIISGCNGSGKTTTAKQILPYFLDIYEYQPETFNKIQQINHE